MVLSDASRNMMLHVCLKQLYLFICRLRLIRRRRRAAGAELIRRRRRAAEADMAMLNLKLHLENRRILAENERLRERASVLRRENLTLRENLCKTVVEAAPPADATNGC
jgi:hypothetical protein